jgi:hypothetical protein
MAAPSVHYGDEVIPVDDRFKKIVSKLDKLGTQLNVLTIVIALHLLGIDLAVGSSLLKLLHLV